MTICQRTCGSQCDDCHDLDNCVPAVTAYGDLTLCRDCRRKYPAQQPWRIDAETGECEYFAGKHPIAQAIESTQGPDGQLLD